MLPFKGLPTLQKTPGTLISFTGGRQAPFEELPQGFMRLDEGPMGKVPVRVAGDAQSVYSVDRDVIDTEADRHTSRPEST